MEYQNRPFRTGIRKNASTPEPKEAAVQVDTLMELRLRRVAISGNAGTNLRQPRFFKKAGTQRPI
jgi:hypothetical protein